MPDISIIIVNYNVQYFIEQALVSIKKATHHFSVETIVVDNDSSDQSVALIKEKFPEVVLIENKENVGFGRANNQGIKMAKGKYILLLNPDTVLQENTLQVCVNFIEKHADCGAIGVRMIDGKGNFLPESKRSLPTPLVAFYKLSGLTALFPKSKTFGKYHLAYLNEKENHEVDVLSGAFMFFRSDLLKKIGGFDEDYFMYGEDIELSYQVSKHGFKNYYVADTSIIHYKGESTKKGSLNYVKEFYKAMLIFARKNFSSGQAKMYSIAIYFAIFIKGFQTLLNGFLKKHLLGIADFIFSLLATLLIAEVWALKIKQASDYYPQLFYTSIIPLYSFIWIVSAYFTGAYEKPFKSEKAGKGIVFGTLVIAAIYGFLPNDLRFSRAIIVLGALATFLAMLLMRFLYNLLVNKKAQIDLNETKKLVIIGDELEAFRARNLLNDLGTNGYDFIGFVGIKKPFDENNYLGDFINLKDIVDVYDIDELIFCNNSLNSSDIFNTMIDLGNKYNYKILPENSNSIIGSNSKNAAGDLYAIDVNLRIDLPRNRFLKRCLDVVVALIFIVVSPILFLLLKDKKNYFSNCWNTLIGNKTWVGYYPFSNQSNYKLPLLKPSVFNPAIISGNSQLNIEKLNLRYAKEYRVLNDLRIIFKALINAS